MTNETVFAAIGLHLPFAALCASGFVTFSKSNALVVLTTLWVIRTTGALRGQASTSWKQKFVNMQQIIIAAEDVLLPETFWKYSLSEDFFHSLLQAYTYS